MLERMEMQAALAASRPVNQEPARECRPSASIRESQSSLIESATGTVFLTDAASGKVLAIVTLHDVLRAQVSISER